MCVIFGFSDTVAGTTEKGAGDSRRSGILFASSINKNNGVLLGSCPLSRDQPPLGDPWASVGGELEYSPPAAMHEQDKGIDRRQSGPCPAPTISPIHAASKGERSPYSFFYHPPGVTAKGPGLHSTTPRTAGASPSSEFTFQYHPVSIRRTP